MRGDTEPGDGAAETPTASALSTFDAETERISSAMRRWTLQAERSLCAQPRRKPG